MKLSGSSEFQNWANDSGYLIPCPLNIMITAFPSQFPKIQLKRIIRNYSKVWCKGFKTLKWTHPTLNTNPAIKWLLCQILNLLSAFFKQSESIKAMCPERNHPSLAQVTLCSSLLRLRIWGFSAGVTPQERGTTSRRASSCIKVPPVPRNDLWTELMSYFPHLTAKGGHLTAFINHHWWIIMT